MRWTLYAGTHLCFAGLLCSKLRSGPTSWFSIAVAEGLTTDSGVDNTCFVCTVLNLTSFCILTAVATSGVTVPTFGFGIKPRGPKLDPMYQRYALCLGEAITTSNGISPALTRSAKSSIPTTSAPAAFAFSAFAPVRKLLRELFYLYQLAKQLRHEQLGQTS